MREYSTSSPSTGLTRLGRSSTSLPPPRRSGRACRSSSPDDAVWSGKIWWSNSRSERQAAVVYAADGRRLIAIDTNGDGRFGAGEVHPFLRAAPESGDWDLTWTMRDAGPFASLPLRFRVLESNRNPEKAQPLHVNDWFLVYGQVNVDGRPVRVAFQYRSRDGRIDPRNGSLGVDGNGDGVIDVSNHSPEWAWADNESVVFRAGGAYLSIEAVDLEARRFRARLHPPAEYPRIELRPGVQVPDFEFVDFEGRPRRLSEFREKVLALDFWGSWCGPCIAQLPKLKEIHARYRSRGFGILGMNNEKEGDPAQADAVVARFQLPWTQARTSGILELIERRFRISSWPTLILVDSERRIIAAPIELDKLEAELAARLGR
ncbi:MAG: TlpA family protein disulfide reductase [Bryobacterales bacterium]|nr:TlpA family protein disulfide reductase [Bryobacterales bacterium]